MGGDLPTDSLELYRIVKCFYIMGGIAKLFNAAIMLLFFYMAFQFDGKLLTGYQDCFEKL